MTMSNEPVPTRHTEHKAKPWVSMLAVFSCALIYLALMVQGGYESWESLSGFGYHHAKSMWEGAYWALFTSAFVHFEIWHIAFNVYWLWVLGTRLERAMGSPRFLMFFVLAAFVSSSFELAVSDDTGIGASGVVYSIFGYMWLARHRYPSFREALDTQTINIFLLWLVGCVVATYLDVWNVGNAAHVSGLLFGCAVAGSLVLRRKRRVILAGLVAMVGLSFVPLFWCPWSVGWLAGKAYEEHEAKRYDAAIDRYTQILRIDPDNAWAYWNRGWAHQELGHWEKAKADLLKAVEIDPSIKDSE